MCLWDTFYGLCVASEIAFLLYMALNDASVWDPSSGKTRNHVLIRQIKKWQIFVYFIIYLNDFKKWDWNYFCNIFTKYIFCYFLPIRKLSLATFGTILMILHFIMINVKNWAINEKDIFNIMIIENGTITWKDNWMFVKQQQQSWEKMKMV